MADDITKIDEEAETQNKLAQEAATRAAEAHRLAALEHEKQADDQEQKSKS